MHGSNRLGGNSLSDLLVFGRRAGLGASAYVDGIDAGGAGRRPQVHDDEVTAAATSALAPFEGGTAGNGTGGHENPYALHQELQQTMNDLVGIIRHEEEMLEALARLEKLKERAASRDRRGAPAVQPRLAPRPRPAEHAPRLGVRGPGRPGAAGEPRAATPATTTPRPARSGGP